MSFVTSVISDHRIGAQNRPEKGQCGSLDQAIAAVRRLNGKQYTEVILSGGNKDLIISGGNNGRYIALISIGQDETFYNLINSHNNSSEEIEVVAGGQVATFPTRQIVSLDAAITALQEFYETGEASSMLTWERQS